MKALVVGGGRQIKAGVKRKSQLERNPKHVKIEDGHGINQALTI
jgi:hypothetical protein